MIGFGAIGMTSWIFDVIAVATIWGCPVEGALIDRLPRERRRPAGRDRDYARAVQAVNDHPTGHAS